MLTVKWDLLAFLVIVVTVFSTPSIAADPDQTLPDNQTLVGQLEILIADNFETGVSERRYAIRVKQKDGDDRLVSLSFASIPPDNTLRSGEQVTVEGRWIEKVFAVDSLERLSKTPSDGIVRAAGINRYAPLTIGDRRAIIMIVDMNDAQNEYRLPEQVISMMYEGEQNLKGLFEASSYGQLSFEPDTDGDGEADVFGPILIDHSATDDCTLGHQDVIEAWAKAADEASGLTEAELMRYQHRIYMLPNAVNCGWAGMGLVGCPEVQQNENFKCRVWVPKSSWHSNEGPYIAHELGHNLSWGHSSTDPENDGIMNFEYGDKSGIMGNPHWDKNLPPEYAQANAPHRDQLGWFDDFPDAVVTPYCSGNFELHALELDPRGATMGTQVVKIHKPDTFEYYYLSYRRATGPYPSNPDYANKINVHRNNGDRGATYNIDNMVENGVFRDAANGITVRATSTGGATATVRVELPNTAPEAAFTHAVTDGHLSVRFTNQSADHDDNIASYLWEIDGITRTGENPAYTFPAGGSFPVTLTVTDDCGSTNVVTQNVVVVANTPPTADFSSGANHLIVQFIDASKDSDGTIASHLWNFGDSNTSNESEPRHTYAAAGSYEVTLMVTDDDGATGETSLTIEVVANKPPEANFTSTANGLDVQFTDTSDDLDGQINSHQWKFLNDESVSNLANPGHAYASAGIYKVQLTVTDDDGASDTKVKDVEVSMDNVAPTADFTPEADKLNVVFTDASSDSDGDIESHLWDFGDTGTSTETGPSHTYASPGTYTVTLTVTDNLGETDTVTKSITVDVNNVPPAAAFTFTTDGADIQFSDTSTDIDGDIESHQWDFGDGETSTETSPLHTYASADTYAVTLTVTDNGGATHTFTENVDVDLISPLVVPTNSGGGGGGGCFIGQLF